MARGAGRLRLGNRVRSQEDACTAVGLTGMRVRPANALCSAMLVDQVHLPSGGNLAVLGAGGTVSWRSDGARRISARGWTDHGVTRLLCAAVYIGK